MEVTDMAKEVFEGIELSGYPCQPFHSGKELVEFLNENDMLLHMEEQEANVLLGYLEGHDFQLGAYHGELYRGDLSYEREKIYWEKDTIDDVIDCVCDWNYDLLSQAQEERENPVDFVDFVKKDSRYQSLCEDEKMLDTLFDRTKYGKQIEEIAQKFADEIIQGMNVPGSLDETIGHLKEALSTNHVEQALPEIQKGRSR